MFKIQTNEMYAEAVAKHGQDSAAIMAPPHLHALRMSSAAELLRRHIPPKVSIIDMGCGMGTLLDYLEPTQYSRYIGVDPSQELLKLANEKHSAYMVKFVLSDLQSFAEQAEYVVCLGVAAHLEPTQKALNDFAGLLTSRATRGVIVEFQNAERYKGQFTAWTKQQVSTAFCRRISPAYTIENSEDSVFTCCFSLQ